MVRITYAQLASVLGEQSTEHVHRIAEVAESIGVRFALVGGGVRDVMLKMPTTDYDFLVDGGDMGLSAAAELAGALRSRFGGVVKAHEAFGTATWTAPDAFFIDDGLVPEHFDFASARTELYERPGALPIPAATTLEDDLRRRDYSVNALALMLAPRPEYGVVIDRHDGLFDLDESILRVMHPASFQDDPTRIYRGARLSARLGFMFAPETEALIPPALPVIDNVSGERLRTELRLILVESSAPDSLTLLDELGALAAIHPALGVTHTLDDDLLAVHDDPPADLEIAAWCAWLCRLDPADLKQIAVRLAFSASMAGAVNATAALVRDSKAAFSTTPSIAYHRFHGLPDIAVATAGQVLGGQARANAEAYLTDWRRMRTVTTGQTLKELGIAPGPRYKYILKHLLDARLDGHIQTPSDEAVMLQILIDRLPTDDPA
ncbi:MAG: CCA tRNA nucleotidyltransferase [Chloroflexi bacterium]|nr:MAG: polynucleotide adenylyltransferase-domain containing protein [Chloroflexi bacterium OLB13]MBC6957263.1 CCA tRNA nucleotidyltransferase [Chloroflexota bacterium]MBV6437745.1 CCA-adding enzyme [Anaerolineae bacterium]MDL1916868.1 CCA tRNA nucleotidyltransferase [Anaerolineae bacterium CFX4]MBW7880458.1 CCA tRNA nucleotidyltransferase [Anaerolineae bacterium]